MLAVGALYTLQAAGTAALIVPAEKRGSTIGLVFALYGVSSASSDLWSQPASSDRWGAYFRAACESGARRDHRMGAQARHVCLHGRAGRALGAGFAATNSMQQVGLVAAAPRLAPVTVSLNTSVLYIGQAVGSAVGGALFARDLLHTLGFVAVAFLVPALTTVFLTRPSVVAGAPAA